MQSGGDRTREDIAADVRRATGWLAELKLELREADRKFYADRRALVLADLAEGRKIREIADMRDIPIGSVNSIAHAARKGQPKVRAGIKTLTQPQYWQYRKLRRAGVAYPDAMQQARAVSP